MNSYRFLSSYYDRFTDDVGYEKWADFFEKIFEKEGLKPHLVVDLACGTGTLTAEMTKRGYEMIGVDASAEMLMQAMNQTIDLTPRPIFLNQRMENLDLFGTVDACLCCLDSINYVTDENALKTAFEKVHLFLEPNGIFIFDVNTKNKFDYMNGQCYVREDEDVFCVWQVSFDGEICEYNFDIFEKSGTKWTRLEEQHLEKYYSSEKLCKMLSDAGFIDIKIYAELSFEPINQNENRIFISARKRKLTNE